MNTEVPISLAECRKLFGRGRTWMSGIKNAMGVKGNFVFVSQVSKFLRENPGWTESHVYRRREKPREWKVQVRAGAGFATHLIRAPKVSQVDQQTVSVGRIEIVFGSEVILLCEPGN